MTEWHTRSLTIDESAALMRKLTIEIGHNQANKALRVIADMGAGIFMAKERTEE